MPGPKEEVISITTILGAEILVCLPHLQVVGSDVNRQELVITPARGHTEKVVAGSDLVRIVGSREPTGDERLTSFAITSEEPLHRDD
jgi:hypothetical protein